MDDRLLEETTGHPVVEFSSGSLEVVVDEAPDVQEACPKETDSEVDDDVKEGFELVGDRHR